MSVPFARVAVPSASAAAAPPDEPPGLNSRFHGFLVTPHNLEWVNGTQVHDGKSYLPLDAGPGHILKRFDA